MIISKTILDSDSLANNVKDYLDAAC